MNKLRNSISNYNIVFLIIIALLVLVSDIYAQKTENMLFVKQHINAKIPELVIRGVSFEIKISGTSRIQTDDLKILLNETQYQDFQIKKTGDEIVVENIIIRSTGHTKITVMHRSEKLYEGDTLSINGILTILPPLLAISLALIFRQVIVALTMGVWLGATFIAGYNPIAGLLSTVHKYILSSLTDPTRASILLFTTLLGGMIGVISRSGGTMGVVNSIKRIAKNPQRAQVATGLMGVLIFFDDYSNTLIVGNTMRPITDKLRVSREKLSYIVDSTAAPVTSLAVITTWVGFQISLIANSFSVLDIKKSPFITFVQSVPFQFYSILAIALVFIIAITGRDYGPMLKAERRARTSGKVIDDSGMPLADFSDRSLMPPKKAPLRWYNALIPILWIIFGTLIGLIINGIGNLRAANIDISKFSFLNALREIFTAADSFKVLLVVSFTGCLIAIALAVSQRILTLAQSMEALVAGFKSMLMALIILILAGAIGDICADIKTADYVSEILKGGLSIYWLPAATFIVACIISFSTGTSWGTMSILTPLVIPLIYKMGESALLGEKEIFRLLLISIGAIMGGAVWGDHCSPISDTTIMSSMASSSDHIHHVNTQMPYAFTSALIALIVCTIPITLLKISPLIIILISLIFLTLIVSIFGKKT